MAWELHNEVIYNTILEGVSNEIRVSKQANVRSVTTQNVSLLHTQMYWSSFGSSGILLHHNHR